MYPILTPFPPQKFQWILVESFRCQLSDGYVLTIPAGYIFDGHSVPRPFWAVFPPFGRDIVSALVHDYLYEYGASVGYKRAFADYQHLYFSLKPEYNISRIRSYGAWVAIRLFGFVFWHFGQKRVL